MKTVRSQSGQMILEAILILTVLFGITLFAAAQFRQQEFFNSIISGPWRNLAGMIQNGSWSPPAQGAPSHPNSRVTSMRPD